MTYQMSDVFDEMVALLTPERLLRDPRATGEGVPVCVIDSGVERAVLDAKFAARGQPLHPLVGGVFMPRQREPLPYDGHQSTPHGTTVADIILTIAPRVRLHSADVLGPAGTCEVEVLTAALDWAVDVWKCKVINLSMGVTEQRLLREPHKRQELLRAIEAAYYKDVLVFAAAHNDLLDIFNPEHLTWHSNQILFAVPLDVTGADVGIVAHQRVHHIAKTQSITNETLWSRRDVVLLFVATDRIDFDYARDIAQLRFDDPFLNRAQIRAGVGLSLFVLRVLLRFD